jgi:hypothetical protein
MSNPRKRRLEPVPHEPSHRRTWRSLWRRCSCGLPAPCVDRLVPAPRLPYPPPRLPYPPPPTPAGPPPRSGWFGPPPVPSNPSTDDTWCSPSRTGADERGPHGLPAGPRWLDSASNTARPAAEPATSNHPPWPTGPSGFLGALRSATPPHATPAVYTRRIPRQAHPVRQSSQRVAAQPINRAHTDRGVTPPPADTRTANGVTPPPTETRANRGVTPPPTETPTANGVTPPPTETRANRGVTPPPTQTRANRGVTPPPTQTRANRGVTPPPTQTRANRGVTTPPSQDLAENASLPTDTAPEPRATRPTADTTAQGAPSPAPNRPGAPSASSHTITSPVKDRVWLAPWPTSDSGTEDEAHPNPFQDLNLRREPHSGQLVRAPSWDAPTVALAQIGRAGDLTPAQAYRAGRGRSW